MRRVTWVFVVLALSAIATSALAVGKTTVDPNTPGAAVNAAAPETDARLDQKVTYEAKRKTVAGILDDLSKATGVAFKAGYNSIDWQVRDRKMNIFAKDLPLAELMSSIARVMKFRWQLSGEGDETTYRLYMDRKTLLDADAQKARNDARKAEHLTKQRTKAVDALLNAAQLSASELSRIRAENPYWHDWVSSGMADGLGKIIRAYPALGEAIATGQEICVDASQLSPAGQQGLGEFLNSVDVSWDMGPMTLRLRQDDDMSGICLARFSYPIRDGVEGESDILDPDSKLAHAMGKASQERKEAGQSLKNFNMGTLPEVQEAYSQDVDSISPGEPLTPHPDDPVLVKKVKLQPESNLLQDIQAAFSDATGFAVVSDSFGRTKCYDGVHKDEAEIKALLNEITESCRYNWDKRGSVIEFRDRTWFAKRCAQVPESRIEAWRQAFKEKGTLDITELSQIAELTQEQININIDGDEVLSISAPSDRSPVIFVSLYQDVLRAYAALTQDERNKLFTSSGLDLSTLPPDTLAVVEKLISRRNAAFLLNADAHITMSGKKAHKAKQLEYTLTATSSDAMAPIVWKFTTPKYEPPKKDESKYKPKGEACQPQR